MEINGVRLQCRIRGKLTAAETSFTNAVVVGDEVKVSSDGMESGSGIVEDVRATHQPFDSSGCLLWPSTTVNRCERLPSAHSLLVARAAVLA